MGDYDLIAASDWALNNNADILSCSFGVQSNAFTNLDIYYDHVIWEHRRAVVVAAGNAQNGNYKVFSPGTAYNVIAVGGTIDRFTENWGDDIRYNSSCYVDPNSVHNDRNKPEVSAVAQVQTTIPEYGGWGTYSGTSMATPAVAGEVALLINKNNSLRNWPEVTKAIIMATAVHDTYNGSMRGNYDDQEGVGTVVASYAYDVDGYEGINVTNSSFPIVRHFYAKAGEKVRFVITWDSHATYNHSFGVGNDVLKADLDLLIYSSNGTIFNSTIWDNNYEVVDFIAYETGNYNATINATEFGDSYGYIGIAVYVENLGFDFFDFDNNENIDIFDAVTALEKLSGERNEIYNEQSSCNGNITLECVLNLMAKHTFS